MGKLHEAPERISDAGVIGYRGSSPGDSTWWNHMSARRIREQIGEELWNEYFKFTVIRNPFDKLISRYHMEAGRALESSIGRKIKTRLKKYVGQARPIDRVRGRTEIERFRSWIALGGHICDRKNYMIDDKICLDYFIRFEDLTGGIDHVFKQLGIDAKDYDMPHFKGGYRKSKIPIRDYYDSETEAIVRKLYSLEFEYFGYDMPQ